MLSKFHLSAFLVCFVYFLCPSQNTFVPDDNFEQALISKGFDTGPLDDFVPTANISGITEIDLSLLNIQDLTGIEDFAALQVLECSENDLTNLDISKNTNLIQLFCGFNKIESLDVSKNLQLRILWCNFNRIPTLDISNNTNLLSLICSNNLLLDIDVSNNLALNTFICVGNAISDFDVSKNSELKIFHCGNNRLTRVDISNNPLLNVLNCEYNNITNLDLSQNPVLDQLFCLSNQLNEIDVSTNPRLTVLSCGNNQISDLNLTNNPALFELICNDNNLNTLDLSRNGALTHLNCSNNNLCVLDFKNGNNLNVNVFNALGNPDLSCIFVDNPDYSNTNWMDVEPRSNFTFSKEDCDLLAGVIPEIDELNDIYSLTYTLPQLTYGVYFTAANGNGQQLYPGDVITKSQTIYIYKNTGCYSNESRFNVIIASEDNPNIFIPKYFTPNNDGDHDVWQVIDALNLVNTISVYNRHGKLLKFFNPSSNGWDGTFNGQLLPNDTYWYEIVLFSSEIKRGYFALKR